MTSPTNLRRSPRRKLFAALAAAIGAALAATVALFAIPGANAAVQTDTWYFVESRYSGLVWDIPGGSTERGTELTQWGLTGGEHQQFRFIDAGGGYYRIQARHSDQVLDVWGWNPDNGAIIAQYDDRNGTNQQWEVEQSGDFYTFVNRFSGKALDLWGKSTDHGARISQYTPNGGVNQQWRLVPVDGGDGLPDGVDGLEGFAAGTTGGQGGQTVTVSNQADLERYLSDSEPYVIRVDGAINVSPKGTEMTVSSDKTVIGVGTGGEIVGGGFILREGTGNVIIRNLTIRDTQMTEDDPDDKEFDYDGIQMDGASNVWIDHNRITRMNDGLIDSRKDTTNLTVSWNVIEEGNKAFGIGWTDNVITRMTIHHNWIRDTNSRNPSTDNVAYAHLYNNHLQDVSGYGNYSRGATRMVLENSYFENVRNPYYVESSAAQLRESGSICVSCSGRQETNGSAFDPSDFYDYTLHPASEVPSLLGEYAGPQSWLGA
ncbi:RICIN domain-containing protein [Glycomyces sp. L485]|uniref:RICIN domain-containing protein n=1 Tax=Glycomyces sp. L485 TaxID=2909235 RepID=UPI001F4B745C|nr:RICIN domain-containing protein [Glycomyces sp. L485]MCH7230852.1 RICIN domain-containing protein [Glycomyces sp. L485]